MQFAMQWTHYAVGVNKERKYPGEHYEQISFIKHVLQGWVHAMHIVFTVLREKLVSH